jgi:hypothetical protein
MRRVLALYCFGLMTAFLLGELAEGNNAVATGGGRGRFRKTSGQSRAIQLARLLLQLPRLRHRRSHCVTQRPGQVAKA